MQGKERPNLCHIAIKNQQEPWLAWLSRYPPLPTTLLAVDVYAILFQSELTFSWLLYYLLYDRGFYISFKIFFCAHNSQLSAHNRTNTFSNYEILSPCKGPGATDHPGQSIVHINENWSSSNSGVRCGPEHNGLKTEIVRRSLFFQGSIIRFDWITGESVHLISSPVRIIELNFEIKSSLRYSLFDFNSQNETRHLIICQHC